MLRSCASSRSMRNVMMASRALSSDQSHLPRVLHAIFNKDDDGRSKLFGWGDATHAGHGHGKLQDIAEPTELTNSFGDDVLKTKSVKKIACGWGSSLVLLSDGSIYEWGSLDDSRRSLQLSFLRERMTPVIRIGHLLRIIGVNCLRPRQVPGSEDVAFKDISSGCGFSIGITSQGQMVRWGEMTFSHESRKIRTDYEFEVIPNLAKKDIRMQSVSSCFSHFIALDEDKDAWICGSPANYGIGKPAAVELDQMKNPINLREKLEQQSIEYEWFGRVKQVAAGISYCAILSEDGNLFTFGSGIALGHPTSSQKKTEYYPKKVNPEIFQGEKIESVTCGHYHMVAITESGKVYTWGIGTDGQCARLRMESLELEERLFYFAPGLVKGLPKDFRPVKAACNAHQTALISTDGKCIMFGTHRLDQRKSSIEPMTLRYTQIAPEVSVDSIALGWAHYLLLSKSTSRNSSIHEGV